MIFLKGNWKRNDVEVNEREIKEFVYEGIGFLNCTFRDLAILESEMKMKCGREKWVSVKIGVVEGDCGL
jgi:hypothetical protein